MSEPMYYVYVIELEGVPGPRTHPEKPIVYVGQSAVPPRVRFQQHLEGYRSSRYVKRYGVRLRPRLYRTLNPLPSRVAALEREKELARRLRKRGYTVFGGH